MEVLEHSARPALQSQPPRHVEGFYVTGGDEMLTSEWNTEQIRVACKAVLEMVRPPRPMEGDMQEDSMPRIQDEALAYHLLNISLDRDDDHADSSRFVMQHPESNFILNDWLLKFGPLFNIMCKQYQIPYEIAADQLSNFQFRLVEHIQHQRRIFEQRSEGQTLSSSEAWKNTEWGEPKIVIEDGITFLRQTVFLPYIVGCGDHTHQVLDAVHHSRESLYVRLTPYNSPALQRFYFDGGGI